MPQRLPPLNTLRTFEVAARCLSFTQASLELHVTPSAISHQIKLLEDDLGVRLFRRDNNRLLLTDAGAYLLPQCATLFTELMNAAQKVREMGMGRPLNIALRPYFAQKWLLPRMADFWQKHPDIELALHHTIHMPAFTDDSIDLAIAWSDGNFPGLESRLLVNGDLTPVCNPRILKPNHGNLSPDLLADHVLLDEETPANWDRWLELAGIAKLRPRKRIGIDDTNVRLHAAVDGQGFMLTCLSLLERELREGILVAPFDLALPHYSYYLIYKSDSATNQKTQTFIDWLMAQQT